MESASSEGARPRPVRTFIAFLLVVSFIGCRSRAQPAQLINAPGTRTEKTPEVVSWIFKGDLVGTWQDHGWDQRAPRKPGEPMRHLMGSYGGWILANPGFEGTFGGVTFRVRAKPAASEFLEVQLESETAAIFPKVQVAARHRLELTDGWSEVFVSMSELNPKLNGFDHLRIRAWRTLPAPGLVELDQVGLTVADASLMLRAEEARNAPGQPAGFSVDCTAVAREISPLIYGIAYDPRLDAQDQYLWKLNPTSRRWGGNPASRYNWELGNAWNTAQDYFWENVDYAGTPGYSWKTFLELNHDRHVTAAITLPTLGWVSKDTTSFSFPRSEFPVQQAFDEYRTNAGNGLGKDGKPLRPGSPMHTSIASTPSFVANWVTAIRAHEAKAGKEVSLYFLDNEPMLWNETHRDVHPNPVSYDELLEHTIAYASAVKKVAPDALLAGPAEWGWTGYFFSAVDKNAGFMLKPDRRAHGDTPLVEWWLTKLTEHEKKTGTRLVDVLDWHFYPQGQGIGIGASGATDPETNARRIRSTRALWDPRYVDESWINEPIRLIPRMRELVNTFAPGLRLAIGEYNFGAEKHLSGGLALAEALGRFGQEGLFAAWYWTYPIDASPAFWAFRAYRDFDGKGARFEDWSLPTISSARDSSLFAARSADGSRMTLIALNLSPTDNLEGSIKLNGCPAPTSQRVFSYVGDVRGFTQKETPLGAGYRLPAYSITVIELALPKRRLP